MEEHNSIFPSISIEKVVFNDKTEIEFDADDIVLLVGANNVGKSRTLKDIKDDLIDSSKPKIIVKEVAYNSSDFTDESIKSYFEKNFIKDSIGNYNVLIDDNCYQYYDKYNLKPTGDNREFYKVLFSFLSTENRLNISKSIRFNSSVDNTNLRSMKALETNLIYINMLNSFLSLGFGKSIEICDEYSNGTILKKYKIGKHDDINEAINTDRRTAMQKMKDMEDLQDQGDGIRSAVAVLASLIVNDHSLFLIDEPESFLHPPQARLLGKHIVELSRGKQCFISTHSIDFIKGVLEADPSRVKIIKINRSENENSFKEIDNDGVSQIANDRNLKYTNILDGLFYDRLVLCENESDCKFYSAILENLDQSIYQNTLFRAVGGKDQFKKVIPLLIRLNIKYVVIADIDLISNRIYLKSLINSIKDDCYSEIDECHSEFIKLFEEGMNSQVKTQETIKNEINDLFDENKYMSDDTANKIKALLKNISSFKMLKRGGKHVLPAGECTIKFNEIRDFLDKHNVFILECGEIERLVPEVKGHGNAWVEKTFESYVDLDDPVYAEAKKYIKRVFKLQ